VAIANFGNGAGTHVRPPSIDGAAATAKGTSTARSAATTRTLRPPTPQAWLYRKGKGKEAKLSYIGNALTENRHGLVVEAELGSATGTIEREAAQTMIVRHSPGSRRLTLGADKAYDVREFLDDLRDLNVTLSARTMSPALSPCRAISVPGAR